jgi:hypothetical protein
MATPCNNLITTKEGLKHGLRTDQVINTAAPLNSMDDLTAELMATVTQLRPNLSSNMILAKKTSNPIITTKDRIG